MKSKEELRSKLDMYLNVMVHYGEVTRECVDALYEVMNQLNCIRDTVLEIIEVYDQFNDNNVFENKALRPMLLELATYKHNHIIIKMKQWKYYDEVCSRVDIVLSALSRFIWSSIVEEKI